VALFNGERRGGDDGVVWCSTAVARGVGRGGSPEDGDD
jgi:hypothetical protein